jgi:predicted transglutaminase-like cysteine proteinase
MRGMAFLLLSMAALVMPLQANALQSYFINNEVESDNIEMFPKWMDMLKRYDDESQTLNDACGKDRFNTCKLKDWKLFVEGLRGKPRLEQMAQVNAFVNKYPYVEDIVNWGLEDYWETVYEFQRKNSGDCEDYAIAKYTSLRALGVPADEMRIEIVQDLNLGGVIHAILIVFADKQVYVLDNQIKQVMLAVNIYHYKPIYSINETHWWRHLMIQ